MSIIRTTQANPPPGMIDLGIGQPDPALLPLATLRQAAAHRLAQADPSLLAYGPEEGDGYFRQALAGFLTKHYRIAVETDRLFTTAGASQGLDLICTLFTQPGDTIFVEEPSYFLALRIFADHRLKVIGLPLDEQGLILEALEEKLAQHTPAFLYTIPTYHNPASVTLSAERRADLARLSARHNLLVVADEVYQLLNYTTTPPPPLVSYDRAETILSLGSFSKILAPGLRLGWIQTQPVLMKRLSGCALVDSGGGLNHFTSGLIRSLLELGLQDEWLSRLKAVYKDRAAQLSAALKRHLPATVTFDEPGGGFFTWLRLPEQIDAEALRPLLQQHQVDYRSGRKFSCRGELQNYARLSFAFYGPADLKAGAQRLASVLQTQLG